MATDIVQSLFGVTPDMYQQSQQARADQQALQYAQLSPFQQANFAIGRGANMLGGAVGRGLGGEDPELARITMRQQIAGQINFADPKSIMQGVELLVKANDTQGAMYLADVGRKAESEQALTQSRIAQANREAKQSIPNDIQIANEIASLTDAQDQLRNQPDTPERNRAMNMLTTRLSELNRLTTKEQKDLRSGEKREAISGELFDNRSFYQLTPKEKAVVNKRVEDEEGAKAREGAAKFTLPGQEKFADIPKFRSDVQKTIEKPLASIFSADQALQAIDDSIQTNNFVSFNAARVQLAKALGDSQLSKRDVEQAGGDPSLFGKLTDSTSVLFTGTPTLETQNLIKKTLQAVKKVSTNKANAEVEAQRKIAYSTKGYEKTLVDQALYFPELTVGSQGGSTGKKTNTRTLASGKVVTVVEE